MLRCNHCVLDCSLHGPPSSRRLSSACSPARPPLTARASAPLPVCSSVPTGLPAATTIGRNVTIGQACLLRSVTIEDEAVVGDKCVLLEGSLVEKNAGACVWCGWGWGAGGWRCRGGAAGAADAQTACAGWWMDAEPG